jgi:4'-phosphopantetheinyl transferase
MRNSQASSTLPLPQSCSEIGTSEIHLWLIDLDIPEDLVEQLRCLLSSEELKRERRFHFQADRRRFVVSHGMLRTILGGYLSLRPRELRFCLKEHGKPYLEPSANPGGISFNMAHSNELALMGVCRRSRIGVDIEYKDPRLDTREIAQRHFAREELGAFAALPVSAQADAFFATWTRKEAYVKARGEGVFLGLDTFAVHTHTGARPALERSVHECDLKVWRFWDLTLHSHYAAAVTVEGPEDWKVVLGDYSQPVSSTLRERGIGRLLLRLRLMGSCELLAVGGHL